MIRPRTVSDTDQIVALHSFVVKIINVLACMEDSKLKQCIITEKQSNQTNIL